MEKCLICNKETPILIGGNLTFNESWEIHNLVDRAFGQETKFNMNDDICFCPNCWFNEIPFKSGDKLKVKIK